MTKARESLLLDLGFAKAPSVMGGGKDYFYVRQPDELFTCRMWLTWSRLMGVWCLSAETKRGYLHCPAAAVHKEG